jgi:hypothetical protein
MNFSLSTNLAIYTTKENLTTRFVDYSNVYLLPSVCLFGMLTSLTTLAASFKHNESNVSIMTFIFLNSLIDFVFLLIQFWLVMIRCGSLCPFAFTYWAKFYEIYIYLYVGYILVSSQFILGIYVTIERLQMFSGKLSQTKKPNLYVIYIPCLLIAAVLNAPPYLIAKEVVELGIYMPPQGTNSSEILFVRVNRAQFQTHLWQVLLTLFVFFKDPFGFLVFCFVNVLLWIKFRKYANKRKLIVKTRCKSVFSCVASGSVVGRNKSFSTVSGTAKSESNFTLLTLIHCLVYLIGNFIDCFSMLANILSLDIYVKYGFINITGNTLFFASHGVNFFVYYFFNHSFKRQFRNLMRI